MKGLKLSSAVPRPADRDEDDGERDEPGDPSVLAPTTHTTTMKIARPMR
jgi:hypothetical protein